MYKFVINLLEYGANMRCDHGICGVDGDGDVSHPADLTLSFRADVTGELLKKGEKDTLTEREWSHGTKPMQIYL